MRQDAVELEDIVVRFELILVHPVCAIGKGIRTPLAQGHDVHGRVACVGGCWVVRGCCGSGSRGPLGLDPLVVMRVVNGPTVQDVARVPVEGRLAADTEHLAAPRDPEDRNGALGTRSRALANGLGALDVVGLADVNGGFFRSCISLSDPFMARLAYSCAAHATLGRALFHTLDKATAVGRRAGTHDGGLEDSCSRRLISRLLVGHPVLGKLRDHTLHVKGPIDVLDEDLVAVDRAAQGAHLGHELVDAAL